MGLLGKLRGVLATNFPELPDAPVLIPFQERGLALGAVYAVEGALPVNALTADVDPVTAMRILAADWDVRDTASARTAYGYLLGGGHRTRYDCVRNHLNVPGELSHSVERAVTERAVRELPAVASRHGQRSEEALHWFRHAWPHRTVLVQGTSRTVPESVAGWDAARVVHISRYFLDAGYVRPDEAWTAIGEAVTLARSYHGSWESFEAGFLAGRAFWQLGSGFEIGEIVRDQLGFLKAGRLLRTRQDSPWARIAW